MFNAVADGNRCGAAPACGQARTALYSAIPFARVRFTEPPSASRPVGDDRWRKGGPDGPLKMSGISKVALYPALRAPEGAAFLS